MSHSTNNDPMLACPICKHMGYSERTDDNMCECSYCGAVASAEFFELEGAKWDNYETANCI